MLTRLFFGYRCKGHATNLGKTPNFYNAAIDFSASPALKFLTGGCFTKMSAKNGLNVKSYDD